MPQERKYVPSHAGGTEPRPTRANSRISSRWSQASFSRFKRSTRWALLSFSGAASSMCQCPLPRECRLKTKSPRGPGFLARGLRNSFVRAGLVPQQPQARNVWFATATAVAAATTRDLASHSHYAKRVRGIAHGVNDVQVCEKAIVANHKLDVRSALTVTRSSQSRSRTTTTETGSAGDGDICKWLDLTPRGGHSRG